MTDEQKRIDEEPKEPVVPGAEDAGAAPAPQAPANPWVEAFAELEDKPAADAPGTEGNDKDEQPGSDGGATADGDTPPPAGGAPAVDAEVGDSDAGGPLPADTGSGDEVDAGAPADVEATLTAINEQIEQRTLTETTQLFLERADDQGRKLIRQTNGQLGATTSDPDIYRVDDKTGTATFYNPDTGQPFTGPNPRAQAKAWVDAYNEELRDTFNRFAEQRHAEIEKDFAPAIAMLKFTPTYDALDATRQKMLEALIDGYEVFDEDNNHIGYSVDLDKALDQVNRQVAALKESQPPVPPKEPTTPALDMPTSGSQVAPTDGEFTSLAEAMEATQNAELAKLQKK